MTNKNDSDTHKPLTEGIVKKGGVGAMPTVPRPSIHPAGQKPGPKPR